MTELIEFIMAEQEAKYDMQKACKDYASKPTQKNFDAVGNYMAEILKIQEDMNRFNIRNSVDCVK